MSDQTEVKNLALKETAQTIGAYAGSILKGSYGERAKDRGSKFIAQVSVMARDNRKIAMCTPESLMSAMIACLHLDLMPNTPEGFAYIIPYQTKYGMQAQFQVGYLGMIELAYRSGQIVSIHSELVFPEDDFEVVYGTERRIDHKPDLNRDRTIANDATKVYAVAKLTNGENVFEVMSLSELDKVQKTVKAKSTDAPWATWPEMMLKKTAIKRLLKYLPQSATDNRVSLAAKYDSWAEAGKLRVVDGEPVEADKVTLPERSDEQQKEIDESSDKIKADLAKEANGESVDE